MVKKISPLQKNSPIGSSSKTPKILVFFFVSIYYNIYYFTQAYIMKILFSIIYNALILFAITFLLWPSKDGVIEAGIILWCDSCSYTSVEAWKTYLIGGVILGLINITIRPVLKILSLPLFFLFFSAVTFIINAVVLKLFDYIVNTLLIIPGVAYSIVGWQNFIIAVAIFTVLNMVYSILFSKR